MKVLLLILPPYPKASLVKKSKAWPSSGIVDDGRIIWSFIQRRVIQKLYPESPLEMEYNSIYAGNLFKFMPFTL